MAGQLVFLLLVAASPIQDGNAIVAAAWEHAVRNEHDLSDRCIVDTSHTLKERIRQQDQPWDLLIGEKGRDRRSTAGRLARIRNGAGRTLHFDAVAAGLPPTRATCRYRYRVPAPVQIDGVAFAEIDMDCDGLCGSGEVLLLERRRGRWEVTEQILRSAS